jgi:hypothetical protein
MDVGLRQRIVAAWSERPDSIRSLPASDAQIAAFERQFGAIPPDLRWFLEECGGGVVGSEWVDDIGRLGETHTKFLAESGDPRGWRMEDVFVIGWDKAGNPFGIHLKSGKVIVEDHDFGGIHEMASSFEAFLEQGLLR